MEGVKAKGSILHLLYGNQFDTLEKVKAFLDQDPFVKNNGECASRPLRLSSDCRLSISPLLISQSTTHRSAQSSSTTQSTFP